MTSAAAISSVLLHECQAHDVDLAGCRPIGGYSQRHNFRRQRGLDNHRRPPTPSVVQCRAMENGTAAGATRHAGAHGDACGGLAAAGSDGVDDMRNRRSRRGPGSMSSSSQRSLRAWSPLQVSRSRVLAVRSSRSGRIKTRYTKIEPLPISPAMSANRNGRGPD
jgi:hypothetical protein